MVTTRNGDTSFLRTALHQRLQLVTHLSREAIDGAHRHRHVCMYSTVRNSRSFHSCTVYAIIRLLTALSCLSG